MWEIKVTNDWSEAKKLAEEGWELVSTSSVMIDGRDGTEQFSEYYFKKLKQ